MSVALVQYFPQKLQNYFYALVYDQWHMSARILRYLHEKSGADQCYLAIFIISGISIYLIIGDYARFVANTILTAVPILLTYVYPDEKPPFDNLLYYWIIYVIATLFFDPELEDKGSYYWMKMLLLILLVVFPGEADMTKDENNHSEKVITITTNVLNKDDKSDQRSSEKKFHLLSAKHPLTKYQIIRQQQARNMTKSQVDALNELKTASTPINSSAIIASKSENLLTANNAEKDGTILKEKSLSANVQPYQIPSKKQEIPVHDVPQMKTKLDLETKNSGTHTTSIADSLIIPETKFNVFVEKFQTATSSNNSHSIAAEKNDHQPAKRSQIFGEEKFSDSSFITKSEIISAQALPITSASRMISSQMISSDKQKIDYEELAQFTPVRISQSVSAKQDKIVSVKESEIFSARKLQPLCTKKYDAIKIPQVVPKKDSQAFSRNEPQIRKIQLPPSRKPETTYFKIVQIKDKKKTEELPGILLNESIIVPADKHQIIDLKESEGTTMHESMINSSSDRGIQELQNISTQRSRSILSQTPEIISTNEIPLTPLKISTTASTEKSYNVSDKDSADSHVTPKHELKTVSVEELQIPEALKEQQILHEKKSKIAPKLKTESMVQNPSAVKLQISSLKESGTVPPVETQIDPTKEIINTSEKQPITISDTISDSEKNDNDIEAKISHDTSEEKKSSNVITWVATGKTVVSMQNVQTKKVTLVYFKFSN
ncbi:putative integral membrane protein [Acanthocheilonema viteae]